MVEYGLGFRWPNVTHVGYNMHTHAKNFLCKLLVGHVMQTYGSKLSELTCGGYRMSGGVGLKAVIH